MRSRVARIVVSRQEGMNRALSCSLPCRPVARAVSYRFHHRHLGPLLALFVSACVGRSGISPSAARLSGTIVRANSYEVASLRARGLGHLVVVVRSVEHPSESLYPASVTFQQLPAGVAQRVFTDARGIVRFDSIPVGEYSVAASALGHSNLRISTAVLGGCRTEVEIYVGQQFIGIAPPPPMPARYTVTTCAAAK
jgi:hypothetical protein